MKKRRYKITFCFEHLENIDYVLANINILQKSFNKSVSYLIEVDEERCDKVFYYLRLTTSNQIKIEDFTSFENLEYQETGTDKPLGSKSAIDEN